MAGAGNFDGDGATFLISVAAELSGLHAQTLRTYDRLGIVTPERTSGGGRRRYSLRDVAMLREVQRLSQEEGVNLAGIKRIMELTNQIDALRSRVSELAEENAELSRRAGTGGRAGGELVLFDSGNPMGAPALHAAVAAELVGPEDASILEHAWKLATHIRNGNVLRTGRASDVLPSAGQDMEAVARWCGYPPGSSELLEDDYLRTTRQARAVFERLFYGL